MTNGSLGGAAIDLALAGIVVALWGFAYGAYFWPDLRRWWRQRGEPPDARMLRAHAELGAADQGRAAAPAAPAIRHAARHHAPGRPVGAGFVGGDSGTAAQQRDPVFEAARHPTQLSQPSPQADVTAL